MAKDNSVKKKPRQAKNAQDKNRCGMCEAKNDRQAQKPQRDSFE